MRFFNYALRRKQGYSMAASVTLSGGTTAGDKAVAWVAIGVAVWLMLDSVSGYVNSYMDAREAAAVEQHKKRADHAESLVAAALNGGAIVVNKTKAVFFDKAKEISL